MKLKNSEGYSGDIIEIIKNEILIVSFMLFFVTFLFTVNFETKGVFAKPLILFVSSSLFILYGIIIRISCAIIKKRSSQLSKLFDRIAIAFYLIGLFFFIFSCDLLLVGIQGVQSLPKIYHNLQVIVIVIAVIPFFLFCFSLLCLTFRRYLKIFNNF